MVSNDHVTGRSELLLVRSWLALDLLKSAA
jgi:hypothetical protein